MIAAVMFSCNGGKKTSKTTPFWRGRLAPQFLSILGNATQVIPSQPRMLIGPGVNRQYSLAVWWKGDNDLEYFTLKYRNEEQMRKWESQINRLIENAQRRRSNRGPARLNNKLAPPSSRSAVSVWNAFTYSNNS